MALIKRSNRPITPAEAGEDEHDPITYLLAGIFGVGAGFAGYVTQIITTQTFLLTMMGLFMRWTSLLQQPIALVTGGITGPELGAIFPAYIFVIGQLYGAIGMNRVSEILSGSTAVQWSQATLKSSQRRHRLLKILWWAVFLANGLLDYLFSQKYPIIGLALGACTLFSTMYLFPKGIHCLRMYRALSRAAKEAEKNTSRATARPQTPTQPQRTQQQGQPTRQLTFN